MKRKKDQDVRGGIKTCDGGEVEVRQKKVVRRRWKDEEAREREERENRIALVYSVVEPE